MKLVKDGSIWSWKVIFKTKIKIKEANLSKRYGQSLRENQGIFWLKSENEWTSIKPKEFWWIRWKEVE